MPVVVPVRVTSKMDHVDDREKESWECSISEVVLGGSSIIGTANLTEKALEATRK